MIFSATDKKWMKRAFELAQKGAGYVNPNPMVGCVIVDNQGNHISEGYHKKYGGHHAEVNALHQVKDKTILKDATIYVTLEPCSHIGKTPSCASTIVTLPIKRVVIPTLDPNPMVNGKGVDILRKHNIKVDIGLYEDEEKRQNEVFFHIHRFRTPYVILKWAQTLDGKIALSNEAPLSISNKSIQHQVHTYRSQVDAVMIGAGTLIADNPRLTVRCVKGRNPKRIVIAGKRYINKNYHLFNDDASQTLLFCSHGEVDKYKKILNTPLCYGVSHTQHKLDMHDVMHKLYEKGIYAVLVEGGAKLIKTLLSHNIAHKVIIAIAPMWLPQGYAMIDALQHDLKHVQISNVQWHIYDDNAYMIGYLGDKR